MYECSYQPFSASKYLASLRPVSNLSENQFCLWEREMKVYNWPQIFDFFRYSLSVAFWLLLNWGFHLANFRSNSSSKYSTAIWLPIGKFPFCSPLLGVSVGEAVEAVVSELEVDVDLSSSFDVGLTWIMEESQMKNILW